MALKAVAVFVATTALALVLLVAAKHEPSDERPAWMQRPAAQQVPQPPPPAPPEPAIDSPKELAQKAAETLPRSRAIRLWLAASAATRERARKHVTKSALKALRQDFKSANESLDFDSAIPAATLLALWDGKDPIPVVARLTAKQQLRAGVRSNGLRMGVTEIRVRRSIDNGFTTSSFSGSGRFLMLNIVFQNESDRPVHVNPLFFSVVACRETGNFRQESFHLDYLEATNVLPGAQASGWLAFPADVNCADNTLVFQSPNGSLLLTLPPPSLGDIK